MAWGLHGNYVGAHGCGSVFTWARTSDRCQGTLHDPGRIKLSRLWKGKKSMRDPPPAPHPSLLHLGLPLGVAGSWLTVVTVEARGGVGHGS